MPEKSDHDLLIVLNENMEELIVKVSKNTQSIGWLIVGMVTFAVWVATQVAGADKPEALGGTVAAAGLAAITKLIVGRFT